MAELSDTVRTKRNSGEGTAPAPAERRKRRSEDPVTALHYQLSLTRAAARLDAVVLVDESGCLIAGAGAWPTCEELAAYAPLLARPGAIRSAALGTRMAALCREVSVASLRVGGSDVLLCGRGGESAIDEHLSRAIAGCRRILGETDCAA